MIPAFGIVLRGRDGAENFRLTTAFFRTEEQQKTAQHAFFSKTKLCPPLEQGETEPHSCSFSLHLEPRRRHERCIFVVLSILSV
jgi:hypothetical protein